MTSTRYLPDWVRRSASRQPAVPAPTTTKSNSANVRLLRCNVRLHQAKAGKSTHCGKTGRPFQSQRPERWRPGLAAEGSSGAAWLRLNQDDHGYRPPGIDLSIFFNSTRPVHRHRIERRCGGRRRNRDKGRCHLRPVRQHDGHPVAAAEAQRVQLRCRFANQAAQPAMGERVPVGGRDRWCTVCTCGDPHDDLFRFRQP